MDKSWMQKSRVSNEYINGVKGFIEFAFSNTNSSKILCPCKRCVNQELFGKEVIYDHLINPGIMEHYTTWKDHGENYLSSMSHNINNDLPNNVDVRGILNEAFGMLNRDPELSNAVPEDTNGRNGRNGRNVEADTFFKLLKDADQQLYPGCQKFSKLSFLVRIYHIKCLSGWSNKSFDMLLDLLKQALPEGETLPKSFYETKKIISDLGLHYDKIDACPNDCLLYWKEATNDESCKICGASRWKNVGHHSDDETNTSSSKDRKIPAKILRHFPLVPRLQRLFMSSKTSSFMRWHDEERTKDGRLRHPADSEAWKDFDMKHPSFSSDSRNIRLGLSTDGFNPFRTMSISHSTWPVILTTYNLPPWMCMKKPYLILSLLIPGPSGPGNNIDVYLQPLIEELKILWNLGVETYDANKDQTFQMKAALLWTISDFPAYAMLSGWSTKGRLACPCCNKDTWSRYLKHGRKFCYMGHRRFLEAGHKFRLMKRYFDGQTEYKEAPVLLSGSDVLKQIKNIKVTLGKKSVLSSRKRGREEDVEDFYNWKKKSIFFDLPYWQHNLLRHSLDVMHIEKNICDNIIGTLLNIEGKSKDNLKARLDLKEMNIRSSLHPTPKGNKTYLPPTSFTMTKEEKHNFCNVLKQVKVPDGYGSNISRCVNVKDCKLSGLKSHDCHMLIQQLLPIALRGNLPRAVIFAIIELCAFFRGLCSKNAQVEEFQDLEDRIAITLCKLEMIFPPTFFDVMEHLPIHLASEAKIAGPVQYRWMYPIERYLLTLKSYVRNRSRPEGSIAEGYLAEECLTFISRYFDGVETRLNRPVRNDDLGNTHEGRPFGKGDLKSLDHKLLTQAHRYVLFNHEEIQPLLRDHMNELRQRNPRGVSEYALNKMHSRDFNVWLRNKSRQLGYLMPDNVRVLAEGPDNVVQRYKSYIINGLRFHTKGRDRKRRTQNSGVVVVARTSSFASSRDTNPSEDEIAYYGVLTDIIELNYFSSKRFVLFKCDWVDVTKGVTKDDFGFTLVNFAHISNSGANELDEPFVFPSQATQVFYVKNPLDPSCSIVVHTKPRDLFQMNGDGLTEDADSDLEISPIDNQCVRETMIVVDDIPSDRPDVPGVTINTHLPDDIDFVIQDDSSEDGFIDHEDIESD